MVLLIMTINLIGGIRRDEAKQYLDNILVAPKRRSVWLASRLVLAFFVALVISLLGGLALYSVAGAEHISIDLGKVLATCICAVGSMPFWWPWGTLLRRRAPCHGYRAVCRGRLVIPDYLDRRR